MTTSGIGPATFQFEAQHHTYEKTGRKYLKISEKGMTEIQVTV